MLRIPAKFCKFTPSTTTSSTCSYLPPRQTMHCSYCDCSSPTLLFYSSVSVFIMHIRDPEHGWATGQPGELSAVGGRLAFLCFGHLDTRTWCSLDLPAALFCSYGIHIYLLLTTLGTLWPRWAQVHQQIIRYLPATAFCSLYIHYFFIKLG